LYLYAFISTFILFLRLLFLLSIFFFNFTLYLHVSDFPLVSFYLWFFSRFSLSLSSLISFK
jgi:hypothetical protein